MNRSARLQGIGRPRVAVAQLRGEIPSKQPAWLTEAVVSAVHGERGRAKSIAAALRVSEDSVYAVADINNPKPVRAYWLPTLCRETGSFAPLDALEAQLNRVAFQLPAATTADHSDVVAHTALTVQHFGEALTQVSASLQDGTITREEEAAIVKEIADVHAALASLQALVSRKVAA
jgi:hypothetical protein